MGILQVNSCIVNSNLFSEILYDDAVRREKSINRDEARYWPLDIFANFDSSTEKSSNLIYFIMTDTVIKMISFIVKNLTNEVVSHKSKLE